MYLFATSRNESSYFFWANLEIKMIYSWARIYIDPTFWTDSCKPEKRVRTPQRSAGPGCCLHAREPERTFQRRRPDTAHTSSSPRPGEPYSLASFLISKPFVFVVVICNNEGYFRSLVLHCRLFCDHLQLVRHRLSHFELSDTHSRSSKGWS